MGNARFLCLSVMFCLWSLSTRESWASGQVEESCFLQVILILCYFLKITLLWLYLIKGEKKRRVGKLGDMFKLFLVKVEHSCCANPCFIGRLRPVDCFSPDSSAALSGEGVLYDF